MDDELSLESSNAVQNKVITAALNDKVDKTDFDLLKENISKLAGISYGTREY
jgi:hypothetical protein